MLSTKLWILLRCRTEDCIKTNTFSSCSLVLEFLFFDCDNKQEIVCSECNPQWFWSFKEVCNKKRKERTTLSFNPRVQRRLVDEDFANKHLSLEDQICCLKNLLSF